MSYLLKSEEQSFIVSFCTGTSTELTVLATNTREFYCEKVSGEEVMERVNEDEGAIRLNFKRTTKLLKQKPESYKIDLGRKHSLHLSLEFEIKSSRSTEIVNVYFKLQQCTTPEEVGKYFFTGLLKSLVIQSVKGDAQSLSSSMDVRNLLNGSEVQDLCKMIGFDAESEEASKEQSDDQNAEEEATAAKVKKEEEEVRQRPYKRAIMEKDFEYANVDSQELELPSEQTAATKSINVPATKSQKQLPQGKSKKAKMNVKF